MLKVNLATKRHFQKHHFSNKTDMIPYLKKVSKGLIKILNENSSRLFFCIRLYEMMGKKEELPVPHRQVRRFRRRHRHRRHKRLFEVVVVRPVLGSSLLQRTSRFLCCTKTRGWRLAAASKWANLSRKPIRMTTGPHPALTKVITDPWFWRGSSAGGTCSTICPNPALLLLLDPPGGLVNIIARPHFSRDNTRHFIKPRHTPLFCHRTPLWRFYVCKVT